MRNIKITALLLAVLMVVAAFAGCASKTTVSNLDNQVNELDGKLQEQANALAGIQDSIKGLADAIGNTGSGNGLDDIKADVEANKQSVADILAAIEGLKDAVAGATGESEDVKTAINQAGAKIDALKGEIEDNKAHYQTADLAAIRELLGAAQAAISSCVTAEAVAAVVAGMEADLAKYARVDDSIYAYYVALKGNITAANEELFVEAKDALKKAKKFYKDDMDALEKYEYDKDEATLDLVEEIEKNFANDFATLETLTKKAKEIVKDIDKAMEGDESVDLTKLRKDYKAFVRDAKALSEENVALVTNADKLDVLIEGAEKINDAVDALEDEFDGAYVSKIDKKDTTIFGEYEALVDDGEHLIFVFTDETGKKPAIALTSTIYDAIDARLEKLAEDFDLSEDGLALVITKYRDKDFQDKYEADKAMVKAFEAEYEKLVDGVFADIADLAEEKLTVSSASALVKKYQANAEAINEWKDALIEAYEDLDDDDKFYSDADYAGVVLANFQAMVVKAELVGWYDAEEDEDEVEWKHNAFATSNISWDDKLVNYYYDLYSFATVNAENYAELDEDEDVKEVKLGLFLKTTFKAADTAAKAINKSIKDYRENQAISIVDLATAIGGYVKEGTNKDGKPALVAVPTEDVEGNPYVQGTIAWFMYEYKTDSYDLSDMIDVAAYEKKLAAVEKNIEDAEAALKALMSAYKTLLGKKNAIVVTLDNADAIVDLKALLVAVNANGHIEMQKATLENTTADGVKEYELTDLVAAYIDGYKDLDDKKAAREAFYNTYLKATNYANTTAVEGAVTVDTGVITRLVYQAETLKNEAAFVASAYTMMQKLNGVNGGEAFKYANNNNGYAVVTNMADANYRDLAKYGYMYGVLSYETTTKTVNGETKYGAKASVVRFKDTGFYTGSYTLEATKATEDEAKRAAWADIKADMLYGFTAINSQEAFATYMFADDGFLKKTIRDNDYEALGKLKTGDKEDLQGRIIPAIVLPMMATYLEAKFMINNMGETAEAITKAKNGWGETTSNYGFGYIKAMVANQFDGVVNDSRLDAIGNAANYDKLTVAVKSACQDANVAEVVIGAADATWLAETYDIRYIDCAIGGAVEADADAYNTYYAVAEGEDYLEKLAVEGIVIFK